MKSLMSYTGVLAVLCLSSVYSKPIEKCETLEKNARNCLSESKCERNSECFGIAQIYSHCRVVPLYAFDEDLNGKLEQHIKKCQGPVLNSIISRSLMLSDEGNLAETTTEGIPAEATTGENPAEATTEETPAEATTSENPATTEENPAEATTEGIPAETTTEEKPDETTTEGSPAKTKPCGSQNVINVEINVH